MARSPNGREAHLSATHVTWAVCGTQMLWSPPLEHPSITTIEEGWREPWEVEATSASVVDGRRTTMGKGAGHPVKGWGWNLSTWALRTGSWKGKKEDVMEEVGTWEMRVPVAQQGRWQLRTAGSGWSECSNRKNSSLVNWSACTSVTSLGWTRAPWPCSWAYWWSCAASCWPSTVSTLPLMWPILQHCRWQWHSSWLLWLCATAMASTRTTCGWSVTWWSESCCRYRCSGCSWWRPGALQKASGGPCSSSISSTRCCLWGWEQRCWVEQCCPSYMWLPPGRSTRKTSSSGNRWEALRVRLP